MCTHAGDLDGNTTPSGHVQDPEYAARALRRAQDPEYAARVARRALRAKEDEERQFMSSKKVILAGRDDGIGSRLISLFNAIHLAKKYNIPLVVNWTRGLLEDYAGTDGGDVVSEFFDIESMNVHLRDGVVPLNLKDVDPNADDVFVFEDVNTDFDLDSPLVLDKYRKAAASLKLSDLMRQRIDRVFSQLKLGESFTVGVHIRHGNGESAVVPPTQTSVFKGIDSLIKGHEDNFRLFVCSDCPLVIKKLMEKYGKDYVVVPEDTVVVDASEVGCGPLHASKGTELEAAKDSMTNMYVLGGCNAFLASYDSRMSYTAFLTGTVPLENIYMDKNTLTKPRYKRFRQRKSLSPELPIHLKPWFKEHKIGTDGFLTEKREDGGFNIYYKTTLLTGFSPISLKPEASFDEIKRILLNARWYI